MFIYVYTHTVSAYMRICQIFYPDDSNRYLCLLVYVHRSVHRKAYILIYVYTHTYMYVQRHACAHVHMYYMYVASFMYVCARVYSCKPGCMLVYACIMSWCTYILRYIEVYAYICEKVLSFFHWRNQYVFVLCIAFYACRYTYVCMCTLVRMCACIPGCLYVFKTVWQCHVTYICIYIHILHTHGTQFKLW
jgi:hypothetical protein